MFNKKLEILYTAAENLSKVTGVAMRTVQTAQDSDGLKYDELIEISIGKRKRVFLVEIKNELRSNQLPHIRKQDMAADRALLLVCQYIPSPLKKELKDLKINYLEATGNCYIGEEDLFVFVNDQQVSPVRLPVEGKLWKAAGLKFLFAILRNPQLINDSYRRIAEKAGVALGNVGGYLDELRKEGFLKNGIINNVDGVFIENKARLIQRWAEAYHTNLRPKQWVNNFRFMNLAYQKDWRSIKNDGFKWGGENAAALLTNYLQPEKFTLYIAGNRLDLMKRLRLIPDPKGNVEMIEQFWPEDETNAVEESVAPQLQVYADLIMGHDSRTHEAAERIKTHYFD